jgi:ubiquinone/menaquinone biosynthesis C-methylase UbiE
MVADETDRRIEEAARSFDAELHTQAFAETHSDAAQLERLLSYLSLADGQVILDLGTGNGYVAMAVAGKFPGTRVIGVDVATQAIGRNRELAEAQGLSNVEFLVYDGVTLPFPDNHFDAGVSRYVFHHLPRPDTSLTELARTLRANGRLVLADAVRHEADEADFINRFQKLKRDGHIRMHRRADFIELVSRHGFHALESFDSSLSFTRERAPEYDALLAAVPETLLEAYSVAIADEEIALTFPILSAVFENTGSPR